MGSSLPSFLRHLRRLGQLLIAMVLSIFLACLNNQQRQRHRKSKKMGDQSDQDAEEMPKGASDSRSAAVCRRRMVAHIYGRLSIDDKNIVQRTKHRTVKRKFGVTLADCNLETAKRRRSVNAVAWSFKLPTMEELELEELVFKQTIMVSSSKMAIGNASPPSGSSDSVILVTSELFRRPEGEPPADDRTFTVNGYWQKDPPTRRLMVRRISPLDSVSENDGIFTIDSQIPISWLKCSVSRRYLLPQNRVGLGVPFGDLARLLFKKLAVGSQTRSLTST
ncbi:unnamed protein product [Linum trigynum]|uniref:Uncharacterized protein n=1 Tax=Linum trigynum TaxID=586398 RepID=A0AAV2DY26_9ROSI